MGYIPEIITVSKAREKLYRLIDRVSDEGQPIIITGKRKNAVLLSQEEWNSMQETLYLHSIPGMVESIKEAAKEPLDKAVKVEDLAW
jgi:antitoxin YefM